MLLRKVKFPVRQKTKYEFSKFQRCC